ncbi:hypothetical protein MKX72_07355 [Priestia sp. FSL R5-0597]|uniref:hypothetical protein n=1 Tax=Priestia TaxID=2800373 RepID=UPI0012B8E580|nr:hypothetical protein [Priestia megaterium]
MLKMTRRTFAVLPNVAFAGGTEYHLTKDELMVFVHIQFVKQVGLMDTQITRIYTDMLLEDLEWKTTTASRDNKRVVTALEGLEKKGYIVIQFDGKKITNSLLTITVVEEMMKVGTHVSVKWKDKPLPFKGYTKIEGDDYNLAEVDGQKMTVIAYVLWRSGIEGYKIAFKEWQLVLNVSDKTAQSIINDCDSNINIIRGEKYKDENGQWRQEPNTYELKKNMSTKSKLEKEKQEVTSMTYLEKFASTVTDPRYMGDMEVIKELYDKDTPLDWKGYEAWKETTCPNLKKAGNDLFAILEKKGQTWLKEKLEKEYQDRKKHQTAIEIAMAKLPDIIPYESDEEEAERQAKHQAIRNVKKKDYSFFDEEIV